MTPNNVLDFIRYHGVVLEAAKGLEPSVAQYIAREEVGGNWWSHPRGHEIYELTTKVRSSRAVLVCVLAKKKITYIHRRLLPAFVRLCDLFPEGSLDKVRETHQPNGRHKRCVISFPAWVSPELDAAAEELSVHDATAKICVWLDRYGRA
jgi:hypothetical protein